MDPNNSAQDVHRCDLCDTANVHNYCDVCHVNLCKPCVVDHISDEYDKHKIVSFTQRKSTYIYPKCETHPHKNCKFQCKDCNDFLVCSLCMASEQHRGHIFKEVLEIYKLMTIFVENDIEKLKKVVSPTHENIALDLEMQLTNLDEGYEKLTSEISKQGETWHREIDIIITKMKTEISEIKGKHIDILQKQLDEIKQKQALIKQTLSALSKIKESNEVSQTITYNSNTQDFCNHPAKVKVTPPTFIPKPINSGELYDLFGQITPLSTVTKEHALSPLKPNNRPQLDDQEFGDQELVETNVSRPTHWWRPRGRNPQQHREF